MLRTGRFDLTVEPQRVDNSGDDDLPGHAVTIVPQSTGTIVVCEDDASYATGARIPVVAGQPLVFDSIVAREKIWLASPDNVSIDVVETGVA